MPDFKAEVYIVNAPCCSACGTQGRKCGCRNEAILANEVDALWHPEVAEEMLANQQKLRKNAAQDEDDRDLLIPPAVFNQ